MWRIHKTKSIRKGSPFVIFFLCLPFFLISINSYTQTPLSATLEITHCNANRSGEIRVQPSGGKPPYSYLWKHNKDTIAHISNLKAGTYIVTVTDADKNTVTVFGTTLFLTEDQFFAGNTFKVYNVSELIVVQAHDMLTENLKLRLTDSLGHVAAEKDFYQGSTICHLETNTLYEGEYILSILTPENIKTFPVTIKK